VSDHALSKAQERDLRAAGVEKVFAEQVSSVASRTQLEVALDFIRACDVSDCTKLDRLARSIADLCAIVKRIEATCAALRILAIGLVLAKASTKAGCQWLAPRAPTFAVAAEGVTREAIALQLKISVASVYRCCGPHRGV
jgi:Resolvase, N terminal domain